MKRYTYLFAIAIYGLVGCEPDDICLAETPGTPNLIIVFYDNAQPEKKKEVSNLQITGVGLDAAYHNSTIDSIDIPLKANETSTAYTFIKIENDVTFEESVTFKYDSYDSFISRACGYKKSFTNVSVERSNTAVWIEKIEIITDTISDIKNTHVKILH
ncbi:MAG: DUF6452 family protein [Flavobacteriaceae bacterium]